MAVGAGVVAPAAAITAAGAVVMTSCGDVAPVSRLDIARAVLLVVSSMKLTGPLPRTRDVTSTAIQVLAMTGPDEPALVGS